MTRVDKNCHTLVLFSKSIDFKNFEFTIHQKILILESLRHLWIFFYCALRNVIKGLGHSIYKIDSFKNNDRHRLDEFFQVYSYKAQFSRFHSKENCTYFCSRQNYIYLIVRQNCNELGRICWI